MTSAEQPRSLGEIWRSRVPTQVGVVGAPHPRGRDCCSHGLWPEVAPCLGPSRGDVSGNPFPACLTPPHSVSAEGRDGQVFPHAPSIVSRVHTAHFRGPEGTSGECQEMLSRTLTSGNLTIRRLERLLLTSVNDEKK